MSNFLKFPGRRVLPSAVWKSFGASISGVRVSSMGGGFFDNMWDPYSAAYAYPRTQPRAQYFHPRAPVYAGQRGASPVQPESPVPSRVEDPSTRKTVRNIPVTDGDVPVVVTSRPAASSRVEVMPPVRRFESEDAAATKIQAVYRGYSVRRTEPLKHLKVVMKVKEEFESFKRRLADKEQRVKVCGDAQEKLRWTEGIMALLLRLDQLQGVHPEVRAIRKALAKELVMFQEKLDSMSDASEEVEESEVCDAEEEGAEMTGHANIPSEDAMEEMKGEENVSYVEDVDVEETTEAAADDTTATPEHQEAMEQDVALAEEISEHDHDSDAANITHTSTSEQHVPNEEVVTNPHNQGTSQLSDTIGQSMAKDAEQDYLELAQAEVPMVVENQVSMVAPAANLEEVAMEVDSPQTVPPVDVESDNEEPSGVDDSAGSAPSSDFVGAPMLVEAVPVERIDAMENPDQRHDVGRDETERLANESERPELDTSGVDGDDLHACTSPEERATDAGPVDASDRWMIPASPTPLDRQSSTKSLQAGQPQVSAAGDTSSLSDRALLEQLLKENRKLKECVGKVLHWGKQQNDIIHNLACRIEQLEEHQPQPNLLSDEKISGRKRISNDVGLAGDRIKSLRSKGRRKGKQGNKPQLGYLDSEWLSAESDEYF